MRYLVGDIGGTKTLLALFQEKGGKLELQREQKFQSHDFETLEDIIREFLLGLTEIIDSACFGIAGPIEKDICRTTNIPWVISGKKIEKEFKIGKVFLINDLEANAYGLKTLTPKDFYTLNRGTLNKEGNQVLLSAGTGLGESPILYYNGEHLPTASEGGHVDFAPRDEIEIELLKYLKEKFGHVSYERILSGGGLANLFHFLVDKKYEKVAPEVLEEMRGDDPAKVITKYGLSGESVVCKRTLVWFCSLYGAEAGNLALKFLATGGVFIGGGIAPKIINELKKNEFMRAFVDKGRFSNILSNIPVQIVLEENCALLGAAYFCQKKS